MKNLQVEKQKKIFDRKSQKTKNYKLENYRLSYLYRIFKALAIPGEGRYLDIGCGALGHLVIEAGRLKQEAVGLDLTKELIGKAGNFAEKELGKKNSCQFMIGVAEKLPFPENYFTKISSIAVLEHLQEDQEALAEMARVLRPGGKVFLTVPNSYAKIFPVFGWYYRRVDQEMGHLRHYEAQELKKICQKYGLKTLSLTYTGHWPKILQYGLSVFLPELEKMNLWWRLEKMDLDRKNDDSGLHFDLVLEKKNE